MTIREVLRRSQEYLTGKGVPSPRVDAEHLLAHALGLQRIELHAHHDRPLAEAEIERARELVRRRGAREPLAYVLGEWGFRRLALKSDARALVPRPETEIVVERCLELLRGVESPAVLDVGTGSGAIALALADELPGARVTAVDASPDALALARENASRLGLDVAFEECDARNGLPPGPFDLVVSNPPYVRDDELADLEPEVRDWEPRSALVGDDVTEAIASRAREVLRGWLVLEAHADDARRVAELLESLEYARVEVTRDLAGRERVVEAQWTP